MSGNLLLCFDHPIIARQLNILTNWTTAFRFVLSFNTSIFGRLIIDWSLENINPDMTLYMMSLDVSILLKK